MSYCEHCECHVSAWLDGQLDRTEQVEMIDHLARCESCRTFYAEARALEGLVAAVRTPAGADAPSHDVWKRIQGATGAPREPVRVLGVPAWAMSAAAAIVVAVGLGVVVWNGSRLEAPEPMQTEVVIGESAGEMTEARFIELTKEVLRAEPRYRSAMHRVMEQVVWDTEVIEASIEESMQQPEEAEFFESEINGQMPA